MCSTWEASELNHDVFLRESAYYVLQRIYYGVTLFEWWLQLSMTRLPISLYYLFFLLHCSCLFGGNLHLSQTDNWYSCESHLTLSSGNVGNGTTSISFKTSQVLADNLCLLRKGKAYLWFQLKGQGCNFNSLPYEVSLFELSFLDWVLLPKANLAQVRTMAFPSLL